jgi:hypothetical protein
MPLEVQIPEKAKAKLLKDKTKYKAFSPKKKKGITVTTPKTSSFDYKSSMSRIAKRLVPFHKKDK